MLPIGYFTNRDEIPSRNSKERQLFYMRKAAKIAEKSIMAQKHGAVLVHNDEILAEGWNRSMLYYSHSYSVHAEVDVIHKCRKKYKDILSNTELYIVRIGPPSLDRCLKYSKPCEDCKKAIERFGIPKVYYSTNDEFESKIFNNNI